MNTDDATPKVLVVYNKKNGKMYDFKFKDNGEIIILSQERYNLDDMIVSLINVDKIDFEKGLVELDGKKTN